MDKKLNIS